MPYVKVMIHAVWSTKNRVAFLMDGTKETIIQHIKQNARDKNIYIDTLNGDKEHLHCLFGLNAEMSIAKAIQLIKGESAHWINQNNIMKIKFEWADEYFAISVSESMLNRVREYIKNQELHHSKKTFTEEYEEFMIKYNFKNHG